MKFDKFDSCRFWSNVNIAGENDCWEWKLIGKQGYGQTRINGVKRGAHRIAYGLVNGPLLEGMVIRHTCDNPKCCNPKHLLQGTHQENVNDMVERGLNPRKLTEEQVREIRRDPRNNTVVAREYGVLHQQISRIRLRQRWAHLDKGEIK